MGRLELDDIKYAPAQAVASFSFLLQPGDPLVCRTNGSLELVGKAAVVPPLPERYGFASYLIRLRPNPRILMPKYFHAFLSAPIGRDQIEEKARTTAGHSISISESSGTLSFRGPRPRNRTRSSSAWRRSSSWPTPSRSASPPARRGPTNRPQAIVAKAFRGELVPTEAELARRQGRDYEPASVLLERIRAERPRRSDSPRPKRVRRSRHG